MKVTQLQNRPNPIAFGIHLFNISNGQWYVLDENGADLPAKDLIEVSAYINQIDSLSDNELSYLIEKDRYNKRRSDGIKLIEDMSSQLRINRIRTGGDRNNTVHIQQLLNQTIIHLRTGWWISAQETLSAIAVDAIFTQQLKDSLLSQVNTYIANNY